MGSIGLAEPVYGALSHPPFPQQCWQWAALRILESRQLESSLLALVCAVTHDMITVAVYVSHFVAFLYPLSFT